MTDVCHPEDIVMSTGRDQTYSSSACQDLTVLMSGGGSSEILCADICGKNGI